MAGGGRRTAAKAGARVRACECFLCVPTAPDPEAAVRAAEHRRVAMAGVQRRLAESGAGIPGGFTDPAAAAMRRAEELVGLSDPPGGSTLARDIGLVFGFGVGGLRDDRRAVILARVAAAIGHPVAPAALSRFRRRVQESARQSGRGVEAELQLRVRAALVRAPHGVEGPRPIVGIGELASNLDGDEVIRRTRRALEALLWRDLGESPRSGRGGRRREDVELTAQPRHASRREPATADLADTVALARTLARARFTPSEVAAVRVMLSGTTEASGLARELGITPANARKVCQRVREKLQRLS